MTNGMINVKKQVKAGNSKDDPENHCLACGKFNTNPQTSHSGTASTENQQAGLYIPWKKTFGKDNPKKANVLNFIFIYFQFLPAFSRQLQKKRDELLGGTAAQQNNDFDRIHIKK